MKLKMDIKYIVNETKGIVIAKFEENYFDLGNYLDDHASVRNLNLSWSIEKNFVDIFDLTGKARCSKGDNFDAVLGKVIARKRLMRKFYRLISNIIDMNIRTKHKQLIELAKWHNHFTNKKLHTGQSIENILAKVNNVK